MAATRSSSGFRPPVTTELRPAPSELTRWLQDNSSPLKGVEPGNGFEDLEPIGRMIGDARVVTVCEASHGIRDIFQLKHRLFEYLVTQKGFTTFVITASYADSFSLWRYVRGEDVDPSMALAEMRWWTVDSEEVLELARWMRAYNDNSSTSRRKVSFYGCDVNAPASNVHRVVEYLQQVDKSLAQDFTGRLEPIATDFAAARFPFAGESSRTKVSKAVQDLVGRFSSQSEGWIRETSGVDCQRAHLAAHGLSQRLESLLDPASAWQVKDKSCAENIRRILEMEGPDSKVMVWTHNGHGQRAPFMPGVRPMGGILDEMFGDDHVIIGTAFGEGSLRAIDPQTGVLRDFDVPLPSEETLDGALASAGHPTLRWIAALCPKPERLRNGCRLVRGPGSRDRISVRTLKY